MASPNSTFAADHYVPILKAKQGELGALQTADRSRLVPLMEVTGSGKATAIANAWDDPAHVILIQPLNLDSADDADWAAVVSTLFADLRAAGVAAVPVATTYDGPDTVAALRGAIAADGRGAALRLDAEDLALATPVAVAGEVAQLLSDLGTSEPEVDIVVDAGLLRDSIGARVATTEAALRVVPNLSSWRNLATCFSAFPETLAPVAAKNAVTPINRDDAAAYATLVARGPDREPLFGDYAVGVPFYAEMPWAPIPAIRYAAGATWMIHRAATKADRSLQYVALSTDVVGAAYYAGAGFCAGDAYYSDVATGVVGPGNPMTYVRANTSRHLACVLDRLATLGVP
ncbi:MAG TPA: hypothetical protein PKD80_04240 [Microthrixaceae bacterium]|nr:hypothetical protein [Microthrixaceae bacterium]HMT25132.1 hypothetical protein [Microthrixaceae bacterium]HMT60787.1 hypothetical protein [Microthrixaceae bacterium]